MAVLCFCTHILDSCEKQSNKLINQETIKEAQAQRLQSTERQYLAFHFILTLGNNLLSFSLLGKLSDIAP